MSAIIIIIIIIIMMRTVEMERKRQLQIGTCHLPLQGLNHELLQLLTFNTPRKELRVESRKEALWALGKTGRTGVQMVRYSQEKIL